MKHFRINNVHTNLGFFNLTRFLRKKNQFFYTSLNGIVFPSMIFTTDVRLTGRIACWGYESLVLTRQSPAFNWLMKNNMRQTNANLVSLQRSFLSVLTSQMAVTHGSRPQVFSKKVVLKNFAKFTG